MKDRNVVLHRTVLAGIMAGFFAVPAHAGFEWTPPPAAPAIISPAVQQGPDVPASPPGTVDATELMPVPGMPDAVMAPVESLPPSVDSQAPMIEKESTELPGVMTSETIEAPVNTGPLAQVVGFGSDIPLALAMGQIVPAEFAYSFASNVNMGLKISWNGGKPWDQVLNEGLSPHGLRADVVGTAVVVRTNIEDPEPVTNPMAYVTESPQPSPAVMTGTPQPLAVPAGTDEAAHGEGTANNYPRRTPPQKGFLGSIFTPDDEKGTKAPRPPAAETQGVLIENDVPPEKMTAAEPVAEEAAAFEPAAPAAMTAMPASSTAPQKISYADEGPADNSAILPHRARAKSAAVEARGPILDPFSVKFWQADSHQSLREVLVGWADEAGVEVIWDSGYDYKLPKAISLHGTFPEAVTKVFELYGITEPRPQGRLHPNLPKGPSVLLVENYP